MVDESDVLLQDRIAEGSFGFIYKGSFQGCEVAVKLFKVNFNAGQSVANVLRSLKDEMVSRRLQLNTPSLTHTICPFLGDHVPDPPP
jgi:hypothetical protein